jgi:hypothetical protein
MPPTSFTNWRKTCRKVPGKCCGGVKSTRSRLSRAAAGHGSRSGSRSSVSLKTSACSASTWPSSAIGRRDAHTSTGWWSCGKFWKCLRVSANCSMTRAASSITNCWDDSRAEVVYESNDRCHQENSVLQQLKSDVRAATAPLANILSNWAYVVMASLAWSLKARLALLLPAEGRSKEKARRGKVARAADGVSHACSIVDSNPRADDSHLTAHHLRLFILQSLAVGDRLLTRLFRYVVALPGRARSKPDSGCSSTAAGQTHTNWIVLGPGGK